MTPIAPLLFVVVVPDALGDADELEPVVPDGEVEVVLLVLEAVAMAACWNAVKFFSAVGLTANTMPFAQ